MRKRDTVTCAGMKHRMQLLTASTCVERIDFGEYALPQTR